MNTPNNGPVLVKVARDIDENRLERFFDCHSFALGTWNTIRKCGYSLMEGSFESVITDRGLFDEIRGPANEIKKAGIELRKGDIITFWDSNYPKHKRALHSIKIGNLIKYNEAGNLADETQVESKNSAAKLANTTLGSIREISEYSANGESHLSVSRHCDGKQPWQ